MTADPYLVQHVGTVLQRLLNAFLEAEIPASVYLPNVNNPLYILKSATYVIQTLLGDGFLVSPRELSQSKG